MNKPGSISAARSHATMSDVAREAGVSIKTVSRVINHEPHVTAALRERVEKAIAALDYVPDPAARSLAGARSFIVGLLFDNPSPNYTMKVQAGAYRACIEAGYHLRIDSVDSLNPRQPLSGQLARLVRNSRVDGFVVTPPLTDNREVLDFLEAEGVNYARIAPVTDPGRSPAVVIDDEAAAAAVAQLLWDAGHRTFGLINGPKEHGAALNRRRGFIERLRALAPGTAISEGHGGFAFEGGLAAGRALLARSPAPTAIFCANDDMAAGLMVAAAEAGRKIPADLSLVGYDDSWVAGSVWPYLTTVHQPIDAMAHEAVRILLQRPSEREEGPVRLDWHIVERGTVAPPA